MRRPWRKLFDEARPRAVLRRFAAILDNAKAPRAVVAIVRDDRVVFRKAFGFRESERGFAAGDGTLYEIGSISKPFAAANERLFHCERHVANVATPDALAQLRAGATGDAKRDARVSFVRTLTKTSGTITDDEFAAIKNAGYADAQLVDISLAIAMTVLTNVLNRINDTDVDFPAVK